MDGIVINVLNLHGVGGPGGRKHWICKTLGGPGGGNQ